MNSNKNWSEISKIHSTGYTPLFYANRILTVILTLLEAGELLERKEWKSEAHRLVNIFLSYDLSATFPDKSIFQGLSGVAYRFEKLCKKCTTLDRPPYESWILKIATSNPFQHGNGLNKGAAGIGLVLISYLNGDSGSWDSCLSLSI